MHREQLFPFRSLQRPLPKNINADDVYLYQKNLSITLPEVYINTIRNVNVSHHGTVFKNLHVYSQFLVCSSVQEIYNRKYILSTFLKGKKLKSDKNETYLLCFDNWSYGHFHWLSDFLPRIYISKEYLKNCNLLLAENIANPAQMEILKYFGMNKFTIIPSNQYIHCRNLIVPDRVSLSGDHDPEIMKKVVETISQNTKVSLINTPTKILASRKKARFRKILNESELEDLVKEWGYTSVCFEDYSFQDQIALARQAKSIIGLHGANLANALFMQPGSSLLEFRRKERYSNNCYFSLAQSVDLNFYYQICECPNPEKDSDYDIIVNLEELKKEPPIIKLNAYNSWIALQDI